MYWRRAVPWRIDRRSDFRWWSSLLLTHVFPVLALATVVTYLVLQYSALESKLSAPPVFDDISYMLDGLERLMLFYDQGLFALLQNLVSEPPHSPWGTFAAGLGFAIFGIHDWAPYAMNIACPILILGMTSFLSKSLPWWQRLLIISYVATVHIVALSVFDFRPDFLSASLIASASTLILLAPFNSKTRTIFIVAGLFYGCAMIAKPSCFPFTLLMMFVALALRFTRDLLQTSWTELRSCVVPTLVRLVVPLLLVAVPYYLAGWKSTVAYIIANNYGTQSKIWMSADTGLLDKIQFYVVGLSANWALGAQLKTIIGVICIGVCVALMARRSDAKWTALTLTCLTALSYMIITLNPVNGKYYGLPIFSFALLLAVFFIVQAFSFANRKGPVISGILTLLCLVYVYRSWSSFEYPFFYEQPKIGEDWKLLNALEDVVVKYPSQQPKILFTTTGRFSHQQLRYSLLKKGKRISSYEPYPLESLKRIISKTRKHDIVVASIRKTNDVEDKVPYTQKQGEVISYLKQSEKWQELSFLPYGKKGGFYVFGKVRSETGSEASPEQQLDR